MTRPPLAAAPAAPLAALAALAASLACACGKTPPAAPPAATPATAAATAAAPPAAATPAPAPLPRASGPGTVETHHFHSDALGVDKDYVVYLPGGYAADRAARWPVLYLLHGLGGDETNWTAEGGLAAAADKLGFSAIIVMPDGDDGFYANWVTQPDYDACMHDGKGLFDPREDRAHTCVRHAAYEDYIVRDLIGHVDATYRTIADRRGRAIAGLSMGGFGALELGMRHPDLFRAAASHSGVDALLYAGPYPYVAGKAELTTDPTTWGRAVEPIGAWVRNIFGPDLANWRDHDPAFLAGKLRPGELALYLDCGTEDVFGLNNEAAYLHDVLTAHGLAHAYYVGPGRHDFSFWRVRIDDSLAWVAKQLAAG